MKKKAIYQPAPAAAEYSKFVCNLYAGCTCDCKYCCNRRWKWGKPHLKKCFENKKHAMQVFEEEMLANLPELQKHGLFFSISTDPMLPQTVLLTAEAIIKCHRHAVPVKILTKRADSYLLNVFYSHCFMKLIDKNKLAIGFTLTGHDELEPHASPSEDRIEAMRQLHKDGFKVWASIEPVIEFVDSVDVIGKTFRVLRIV
jgi:DNA repair photolyase